MAGYTFVVSGDQATARDTVYGALQGQDFKINHTGDWSALAERGSAAASMLLGAFAGKKGRHVKLEILCQTDAQGNIVISLTQGTSGASGGLLGASQAKEIYGDIYKTVSEAYASAGVLVQGYES
jgi:hypothetical protein